MLGYSDRVLGYYVANIMIECWVILVLERERIECWPVGLLCWVILIECWVIMICYVMNKCDC